ncbi:hypothetical protein F383_07891 [Gossypium arboreum]|uniref:Uncharacterized protein n=1 Tax=Gossypium arboreum TaxID=29729 RepID=A0A0B0N9X4_GOSAR|nr:hypothetical protein F383_07891 [Gossypium arboreum]
MVTLVTCHSYPMNSYSSNGLGNKYNISIKHLSFKYINYSNTNFYSKYF